MRRIATALAALLACSSLAPGISRTQPPVFGQGQVLTAASLNAAFQSMCSNQNSSSLLCTPSQALTAAVSASPLSVPCPSTAPYDAQTVSAADCGLVTSVPTSRNSQWAIVRNFVSQANTAGSIEGGAAFFNAHALSGAPYTWALAGQINLDPGFTQSGQYAEFDLVNGACDSGPIDALVTGCGSKFNLILGDGSGGNPITAALEITGSKATAYHDGIVIGGTGAVSGRGIYDRTSDATLYYALGAHNTGIDLSAATFAGPAIRLFQNQFVALDGASGSVEGFGWDGQVINTNGVWKYNGLAAFSASLNTITTIPQSEMSGIPFCGYNKSGGNGEMDCYANNGLSIYKLTGLSLAATPVIQLTGNGTVIANAYAVGSSAIPGVSCSGTPTSSFASVNGIVTHC